MRFGRIERNRKHYARLDDDYLRR